MVKNTAFQFSPANRLKTFLGPTVWHKITPLAQKYAAINLGQVRVDMRDSIDANERASRYNDLTCFYTFYIGVPWLFAACIRSGDIVQSNKRARRCYVSREPVCS